MRRARAVSLRKWVRVRVGRCRVAGGDCPEGYRLLGAEYGLGQCRDRLVPRYWHGLSGDERVLLGCWLEMEGLGVQSMWTGVACGPVPVNFPAGCEGAGSRLVRGCYALRADVVFWGAGGWGIVELKRDAGHAAVGQVLTYKFYVGLLREGLEVKRVVVVTDVAAPWLRPVCAVYGVEVVEVGHVLDSGSWPE